MADRTYSLCKILAHGFRVVCRVDAAGMEQIPDRGPCLLVCNHISHADPPILALAVRRPIDFLGSSEFFAHPIPRYFLTALNAFPINRTAANDLGAVKASLKRLQDGRLVGIFPEGGIRHGKTSVLTGAPLPASFVSLAQTCHAPIVPAILIGSDQLYQWRSWLRRPRLFMRFGKPIAPEGERGEIAERVTAEMRALLAGIRQEHKLQEWELPRSAQERWAEK